MSPMCVVRLATWSGHPSSVGLLLAILFFRQFHKKVMTRGISQRANTRVQRALFHALSVADEHRAQYAFVTHVWHECKAARAPLSAARRPAPLQAICLTKVELPCRLTSRYCRLGNRSGILLCCLCLILQVGREAGFSMASHPRSSSPL